MNLSRKLISLGIFCLTVITSLSITGCLVDENDPAPIKNRSTDNFRLIQSGDYYSYLVSATLTPASGSSTIIDGSLNVTYTAVSLPTPFSSGLGGPMPGTFFREYSTLTLGGTTYITKRYIQQDQTTGALSVVAVRDNAFLDSETGNLYRIGQGGNLANPQPVEILPGPVPSTDASDQTNFNFQYMSGCESSSPPCAQVEQEVNYISIEYQGNADITTFEGRFNALRVDYNGLLLGPTAPILFNLKGACDQNQSSFTQSDYIFPEVGVVFMDSTCTPAGGGGFFFTASLNNTNVPIP